MNTTIPPKSGFMFSSTKATIGSEPLKSTTSENDASDILVLPKQKENSRQKLKLGISQKAVCLDRLKAEDKEKDKKNWKKIKEKNLWGKKAEKKRLKKKEAEI